MSSFGYISSALGDLTTPVPVGQEPLEYPFWELGDTTTFILHQKYRVLRSAYVPPTLDSAPSSHNYTGSVDVTGAKCLGDSSLNPIEPDLVEYTRSWALVPQTRVEEEGYAFPYPGLNQTSGYGLLVLDDAPIYSPPGSPTAISANGKFSWEYGQVGAITVIILTLTEGFIPFAAGQSVLGIWSFPAGPVQFTAPIIQSTSDQLIIAPVEIYSGGFLASIQGNAVEIQPRPLPVQAFVTYDYFNTTDPASITQLYKFKVLDPNGNQVTRVTPATDPDYADYVASVTAGDLLIAEDSVVRRWRGNIHERRTVRVRYQ